MASKNGRDEAADDVVGTTPEDGPTSEVSAAAEWRTVAAAGGSAVLVAVLLVFVMLAAFHAPKAHNVPIGVVGSASAVADVKKLSLETYGDAFDIRSVKDQRVALDQLKSRQVYGVLVIKPGAKPTDKTIWLFEYASANGRQVTADITRAFYNTSPKISYGTADLVRPAKGDQSGLAVFFMILGLVLASFVLGATVVARRRIDAKRELVANLVSSIVLGIAAVFLISTVFDSLPGSFAAVVLTSLLAFAVSATTAAAGRLWGLRGVGIAGLLLVAIGVAATGTIYPPPYLPVSLSPFVGLLPPGQATQALTGNAYFNNDLLAQGLAGLVLWSLVGVGLTLLAERRESRPVADPDDEPELVDAGKADS